MSIQVVLCADYRVFVVFVFSGPQFIVDVYCYKSCVVYYHFIPSCATGLFILFMQYKLPQKFSLVLKSPDD